MPIEVVPCTKDDLWGVVSVNIQCLPEHYAERFWTDNLALFPRLFYVAKVNGTVVGYIMGNLYQTIYGGTQITCGNVASVAVLPQYRNQGIATALLQRAYEGIKEMGLRFASLQVRVSNLNAIKLYNKEGFLTTTTIQRYYSNGEDGLLMVKPLE